MSKKSPLIFIVVIVIIIILALLWYFFQPFQNGNKENPRETPEKTQVQTTTTLDQSVLKNISESNDLSIFTTMVKASSDVTSKLSGSAPVTVFVPTNAAFEKLPEGTLKGWFDGMHQMQIEDIVKNYIALGAVPTDKIVDGATFQTIGGKTLTITVKGEGEAKTFIINGVAAIDSTYIKGTNGYIYMIDTTLGE